MAEGGDTGSVREHWERNAEAWTALVRQGFDVYRDEVNTPGFLDLLPEVSGLRGLDVGCGEGHNTRLLAGRGARMTGLDISTRFALHAARFPGGPDIAYVAASALEIPFADESFDFAAAFMSLMDMPDPEAVLHGVRRVLRPGGFFQFSITHPCFNPPHRRLLRTPRGEAYAVEVGKYFEDADGRIDRWIFGAAPAEIKAAWPRFEIPVFHRTLSWWLNAVLDAGLLLERVAEPAAGDETARRVPAVQDTQVVAYFLHLRCRKPA